MRLRELFSCWVVREVQTSIHGRALSRFFEDHGFQPMPPKGDTLRFKRGSAVVNTFDYDSEALQVQAHVTRRDAATILLEVGNWGFPPEPYLMKRRFERVADTLSAGLGEATSPNERPQTF